MFDIVPTAKLATATAPFSDAANAMSGGTWAGNVMAIAVIVSGFGAACRGPDRELRLCRHYCLGLGSCLARACWSRSFAQVSIT